jgi:hypothetical protein
MATKVSRARCHSYLLLELADLNAKQTRTFAHVRPNQTAGQIAPTVRGPTDPNWSRSCPSRHKAVPGKFVQIELQPIFKTHPPAAFWHFNPRRCWPAARYGRDRFEGAGDGQNSTYGSMGLYSPAPLLKCLKGRDYLLPGQGHQSEISEFLAWPANRTHLARPHALWSSLGCVPFETPARGGLLSACEPFGPHPEEHDPQGSRVSKDGKRERPRSWPSFDASLSDAPQDEDLRFFTGSQSELIRLTPDRTGGRCGRTGMDPARCRLNPATRSGRRRCCRCRARPTTSTAWRRRDRAGRSRPAPARRRA